jgi:hypothetical protein
VFDLIVRLLEVVLKMWQGPSAVNTVGSTFRGDNLNKSDSKIKGDSVGIINNMVDRV